MKTESGILMNQFDLMEENQMLKIENEQLKERLEELREAAEKQIPIRPYIVDDEYKGEYCICSLPVCNDLGIVFSADWLQNALGWKKP